MARISMLSSILEICSPVVRALHCLVVPHELERLQVSLNRYKLTRDLGTIEVGG